MGLRLALLFGYTGGTVIIERRQFMIQISEAILHVFDAIGVQEVLSAHPLNPHNVVMTEYISHHIERGLADPAASHAQFAENSPVPRRVREFAQGGENLVDFSQWLAGLFFSELRELEVQDNYHLILARFVTELGVPYLAILALADKLAYTHAVESDDAGNLTASIALHHSIMPQPTQRVKGYAFVNLEDFGVRLCDIKLKHEKETVRIFEEIVLGLIVEPSSRESYRHIRQMTLAVADDYSQDGVEALARAKHFLAENAHESDIVETRALAEKAFPDSIRMQNAFMGEVSYANLPENLVLEREFAAKQATTYKLVADGDVSLTLPAEWYEDPERVEIRMEQDGTTTITIRGIEHLTSK